MWNDESFAKYYQVDPRCRAWKFEYSLFYEALLQKRRIILSILLTEATPYHVKRWIICEMLVGRTEV